MVNCPNILSQRKLKSTPEHQGYVRQFDQFLELFHRAATPWREHRD